MGSVGRISTLLAATALFAALAAAAAAPRGRHLSQKLGGASSTAGAAEESVHAQRSVAEGKHSPAPYQGPCQGHDSSFRRRRLAQNGAMASILAQRWVAGLTQGQQPQQQQPNEDNGSSPAGQAQSADEQPSQGYNNSGTERGKGQSPQQQPNQGYNNPGAERGQAQSPQQQPNQGYNNPAERGQAQSPQQQPNQGYYNSETESGQAQPPPQQPGQGYPQTATPQQQLHQGPEAFPAAAMQIQPPPQQPGQYVGAYGRRMLASLTGATARGSAHKRARPAVGRPPKGPAGALLPAQAA